ncbi:MAG: hypothetical protein A2W18_03130 [Candidatus Muproteobacteria bacterium RBG_16_60_9]|uniref:DUF5615 domain-containing protein n=1 Tax=Candidatus Muproteobacteria bacterium RBG_16_60_9 TaxID=1817755 RepID=A0A1F6V4M9_9PROT|nr:MAG: hypothetical protein A2W18_03130 [Candidatus Muproteobacteria bacterium RBG_16_60_9]
MKLPFDRNLSYRLVSARGDLYPESSHVQFLKLERANDDAIWQYAHTNDFTIVTQDSESEVP